MGYLELSKQELEKEYGNLVKRFEEFKGMGTSPRYKREAVCRECGYTPYACCLCSSSLKKRSDPKEIPAKSRFFRKPYKKREGADCVLPKTKQRVVIDMYPEFWTHEKLD